MGGEAIRIEEAPYQASLQQFGWHICGAAIISRTFVITAAHCRFLKSSYLGNAFVPSYVGTFGRLPRTLTVLVGATTNFEGGNVHTVANVKNHPSFNIETLDFDVALLELNKSITINDITKQEISLPLYGEAIPENTPVLVSGWGNF